MLSVQLLERAEQEVTEAYTWYEQQQTGLGERFLSHVDHYLGLIGGNPYLYPSKYSDELHFAPLKTFPFLIVYWVDQEQSTVFVTSVFHTSRRPGKF